MRARDHRQTRKKRGQRPMKRIEEVVHCGKIRFGSLVKARHRALLDNARHKTMSPLPRVAYDASARSRRD